MQCTQDYSHIRGFNFQPDWGGTGTAIWLEHFNPTRYRQLIQAGKRAFPGINTLRVWLSFDAWCENQALYLQNVTAAVRIVREESLKIVPVYLNGWFGIPVFGAFAVELLDGTYHQNYEPFRTYLRETVTAAACGDILMHDISNEPYNNTRKNMESVLRVTDFLREMAAEVRALDNRPVTVGSQGTGNWEETTDNALLAPFVDVLTLHPYAIIDRKLSPAEVKAQQKVLRERHESSLIQLLNEAEMLGKPVIITECMWGARTAEARIPILEVEFANYAKYGVGYLIHALCTSPVADLHPLGDVEMGCLGLYMAFLDKNLDIRLGHELFNAYAPTREDSFPKILRRI
jgi:hypothetical protein